jgi:hypothetical protein
MTDSTFNGFLLKSSQSRADINAPGGYRDRFLIVIAQSAPDALHVAKHFLPHDAFVLVDSGPPILKRARDLGVSDNDAKLVDA